MTLQLSYFDGCIWAKDVKQLGFYWKATVFNDENTHSGKPCFPTIVKVLIRNSVIGEERAGKFFPLISYDKDKSYLYFGPLQVPDAMKQQQVEEN